MVNSVDPDENAATDLSQDYLLRSAYPNCLGIFGTTALQERKISRLLMTPKIDIVCTKSNTNTFNNYQSIF